MTPPFLAPSSMSPELTWYRLHWRRPLDPEAAVAVLRQWAADQRSPLLVLEARADAAGISYLLGTPSRSSITALTLLGSLATLTMVEPAAGSAARVPVTAAGVLRASTRHRPLRTTNLQAAARAVLHPLAAVHDGEQLVLQVVLGARRVPLAIPNQSPSSMVRPWWQTAWYGNGGVVDGEKRAALRSKVGDHGFACTVRLGAAAATRERRRALLLALLAGLRTSEAPGVQLTLTGERVSRLNDPVTPWRWPLRLNVAEVAVLLGWPLGDDELPGQPALHPVVLPPAPGTTGAQRVVARSTAPGVASTLSLPARAALHHTHVLGPTGVGKSTLLLNLICQDIAAGRALHQCDAVALARAVLECASIRDAEAVLER